ncbi:MAG: flagellar hook-basal body complex protein FliE [Deltaproteobacteria bacterium]|nr:MAG: flagellar hook-basal body complex protein FliE [Deltaproteobacteria bacterium]
MAGLRIETRPPSAVPLEKIDPKRGSGFADAVRGALDRVERLEKTADQSIVDLLDGKADIPETMLALQKVDVSMRLLLTVRNKVIEAYREIMHMQY